MNSLHIILIGLSHSTSSIELREKIAFLKEEVENAIKSLFKRGTINEVVLISTCNRTEFLMVVKKRIDAIYEVKKYISQAKDISINKFEEFLYVYEDYEAVRHIFRVGSSLDSMMVGEPHILGQVKDSYYLAVQEKTSGVILNRLLHKTFFVAKRVRSETGIGDNAVSISYAAIELAKKIFGSLEKKNVLLIGAGEMAELALEHLVRNKTEKIVVANRTFENGFELAKKFNGQAIRYEEIFHNLVFMDIVISSTGSSDIIITRDHVKKILRPRKNSPLFFIDIAVPRDIDPLINRLPNSYVYDIDDLKGVVSKNINDRSKESIKGERIVDEAVINFKKWHEGLDIVPTIVALKDKVDKIANSEMKKTFQALNHFSENDLKIIKKMMDSFRNKIMYDPIQFLKKNGCNNDKSLYFDMIKKLFNIDI